MQREIPIIRNVVIKLYYEEFLGGDEHSPIKLKEHMKKAMDQIKGSFLDSYNNIKNQGFYNFLIIDNICNLYFL
jgi:hypothetical protein